MTTISKVTETLIDAVVAHKDGHSDFDDTATLIHAINVEHGFWEADRNFGEVIALIHSELSEALEEHRSGKPDLYFVNGKPEGTAVEMVDALILLLDYLGSKPIAGEDGEEYTISEVLALKLKYNNDRPYKHGRAY